MLAYSFYPKVFRTLNGYEPAAGDWVAYKFPDGLGNAGIVKEVMNYGFVTVHCAPSQSSDIAPANMDIEMIVLLDPTTIKIVEPGTKYECAWGDELQAMVGIA